MRKIMSFAFGVLVGMVVATAWASFATNPQANTPAAAAASMNPIEMMTNARPLPVQDSVDMF